MRFCPLTCLPASGDPIVKFAKLGALAAAASAVVGLTACQSRVGAAAVVDGHRISEITVTDYLTPKATSIPLQTGSQAPRLFVLQTLIRNSLVDSTLRANGGPATSAELAKAQAAIFAQGGSADSQNQQLASFGLAPRFDPVYLESQELIQVLVTRVNAQSDADVLAPINKLKAKISVNTRYGAWDGTALALGTPKAPNFLSGVDLSAPAAPTAAPSAAPSGG